MLRGRWELDIRGYANNFCVFLLCLGVRLGDEIIEHLNGEIGSRYLGVLIWQF